MTNPFTSFAFAATGEPTNRTLPDRLADIKNVKDFGAMGDWNGSSGTDDLAAIMAAFNWTTGANRGVVYFPPGAYYVSAPIDISTVSSFVNFLGCLGLSTIIGNFSDYVIKRYLDGSNAVSGGHVVEKLTIINQHASGGGIRLGVSVGAAIRDCDITANFGIDTDNSDVFGPPGDPGAYWGSLDISIENCNLRAYNALASGSTGLARDSNGPTINCTFKDFDTAYRTFGGQGGQSVLGCYFEHNNYGMANSWAPTQSTWGTGGAAVGGIMVEGCHFKNNGVAILSTAGAARYTGIRIEAVEGGIIGNPQYGIYAPGGGGECLFGGILVTGQYQVAGVYMEGGEVPASPGFFAGIISTNTSTLGGVSWRKPTTAASAELEGCNVASVWTMSQLPAKTYTIASASWSGGIATITVASGMGDLPTGQFAQVNIAGVTPSGYNGQFFATVINFFTFTYPLASNPGGSGTAFGTAFVIPSTGNFNNVYEGYEYDVSDSDVSSWGGSPIGGGSTHAKVRYNGTNWTVMGA
jgi:Pectate lyase superfamily protein